MNSNKKVIVSYGYINAFIANLHRQLYDYKYQYKIEDIEKYVNRIETTMSKIKGFNDDNVIFINKNSKISPEKAKAIFDRLENIEREFEKVLKVFQKYLQMYKQ